MPLRYAADIHKYRNNRLNDSLVRSQCSQCLRGCVVSFVEFTTETRRTLSKHTYLHGYGSLSSFQFGECCVEICN